MAVKQVLIKSHASEPGTQRYVFFCPGCEMYHFFRTPDWTLTGSLEAPTVEPSILTTVETLRADVPGSMDKKCHLFLKAGQIEYMGDCWHGMKNVKMPMAEV